jgi:hypothetical protein
MWLQTYLVFEVEIAPAHKPSARVEQRPTSATGERQPPTTRWG